MEKIEIIVTKGKSGLFSCSIYVMNDAGQVIAYTSFIDQNIDDIFEEVENTRKKYFGKN